MLPFKLTTYHTFLASVFIVNLQVTSWAFTQVAVRLKLRKRQFEGVLPGFTFFITKGSPVQDLVRATDREEEEEEDLLTVNKN